MSNILATVFFVTILGSFFFLKSLTALALNLLMLFFWASLFLLLVVKVEFLAISFLIIYVGAIAVLIIFGLMVLGVSVKAQRDYRSFAILFGLINMPILANQVYGDVLSITQTRQLLTSLLVDCGGAWSLGSLWVQDVSILGLELYINHFWFFWVCGLLLLVAIFGVIAMTTPTKSGWRRLRY